MPIDRTAILRNAEKLLRQGKLDQAIAEYLRIVEEQPSDWNTANVLGDLYVRASQTDRAIEQFARIADHLHVEGFLPKAAAVYKKILKLKPDHEHAMLQAGDIAGKQGLVADARALYNAISTRRRANGDERGVAEIAVRLSGLDPNDFEARLSGARIRVTLDDVPGAIADLKALAAYMQEKERPEEALRALREAAELDPADADLRAQLEPADAAGAQSEAFAAPETDQEPVQDTSEADAQIRSGAREALETLGRLLTVEAEPEPVDGFEAASLAADAAVAAGDHRKAAAGLEEYLTRVPGDIPALLQLVEVSRAGGLDATLKSSRGQLADAYNALGQGDEARVIAEDLVAREPWDRAHIERFRTALVLIGEDSPDEIIAERLSGQTPFKTLDTPAAPVAVAKAVEVAAAPAPPTGRPGEIDLSVALEGITRPSAPSEPAVAPVGAGAKETVYTNPPEEVFRQGVSLYEAGHIDEAIAPLKAASRTAKHRFAAASLVGRIHRDRGEAADAIEWLERAAQAPAPTPGEGHLLLFDLAEALEGAGETARALAICMELQADAGNYRDVAARIDRLAKVRARG